MKKRNRRFGKKNKNLGGRPSKIDDPDMLDRLINAIRAGNYFETAAAYVGITRVTLHNWMKRGRSEQEQGKSNKFTDFIERIDEAMACSEVRDVALISAAAEKQWQAAAWRLERKYPKKWGRFERHEVTGRDGGPIKAQVEVEEVVKRYPELMQAYTLNATEEDSRVLPLPNEDNHKQQMDSSRTNS